PITPEERTALVAAFGADPNANISLQRLFDDLDDRAALNATLADWTVEEPISDVSVLQTLPVSDRIEIPFPEDSVLVLDTDSAPPGDLLSSIDWTKLDVLFAAALRRLVDLWMSPQWKKDDRFKFTAGAAVEQLGQISTNVTLPSTAQPIP